MNESVCVLLCKAERWLYFYDVVLQSIFFDHDLVLQQHPVCVCVGVCVWGGGGVTTCLIRCTRKTAIYTWLLTKGTYLIDLPTNDINASVSIRVSTGLVLHHLKPDE